MCVCVYVIVRLGASVAGRLSRHRSRKRRKQNRCVCVCVSHARCVREGLSSRHRRRSGGYRTSEMYVCVSHARTMCIGRCGSAVTTSVNSTLTHQHNDQVVDVLPEDPHTHTYTTTAIVRRHRPPPRALVHNSPSTRTSKLPADVTKPTSERWNPVRSDNQQQQHHARTNPKKPSTIQETLQYSCNNKTPPVVNTARTRTELLKAWHRLPPGL